HCLCIACADTAIRIVARSRWVRDCGRNSNLCLLRHGFLDHGRFVQVNPFVFSQQLRHGHDELPKLLESCVREGRSLSQETEVTKKRRTRLEDERWRFTNSARSKPIEGISDQGGGSDSP